MVSASALIVGSVFLMSFGDALIKLNSASFTVWQIFVLRSLIVLPVPARDAAACAR